MSDLSSTNRPPTASVAREVVLCFLGVLALAIAMRFTLAPGYLGTDDVMYSYRAAEIAAGIWRPPSSVGELRYGVSVPMSLFIRAFGPAYFAYTGWSLLCSIAEIALVFAFAYRAWGTRAAILSAILIGLAPIHVTLGSVPLADAPLAFFFTLAAVSFFFAEQSHDKRLYIVAGLAIGASWWVKPHAAVPFATLFVLYALLWRAWRKEWLFVVAAAASLVFLEFALLWLKFGDPLYGIKLILRGVSGQYIHSDSPWGSSSPLFYFRQMFVDGRDMWIVPYLAVAGFALLLRGWVRHDSKDFGARYVLFWASALISIFSFFVFSLNPVKFIPKQENYALMFFAPLSLLGGYALSRMGRTLLAVSLSLFVVGSIALAALAAHGARLHYAALQAAERFAREHPEVPVFASQQVVSVSYLANLGEGRPKPVPNLLPIEQLATRRLDSSSAVDLQYAFVDPSTPEMAVPNRAAEVTRALSSPSWRRISVFRPEASGIGLAVANLLSHLRPRLPRAVDRHLSFTDKLIAPRVVEIYCKGQRCDGATAAN